MKMYLIQGVPKSLQQDGWWLSGSQSPRKPPLTSDRTKADGGIARLGLLVLLVVLGDVLVWQVIPGLSLAVFCAALILGAVLATSRRLSGQQTALVAGLTLLVLLPLVELVQPLSLILSAVGLSSVLAMIAGLRPGQVPRGIVRLWPVGVRQTFCDGATTFGTKADVDIAGRARSVAKTWGMPLMLGAVFVLLLAGANPILMRGLESAFETELPDLARVGFWVLLVPLCWTVLSLAGMKEQLCRPVLSPAAQFGPTRQGFVNLASTTRALFLFNAVFASQTILDIVYLYGGADLPAGITYAEYAHRGAYPLLVTALLAGGFALITRRWTDGSVVLRALLMVWIAQNVALVISSLVRLDIYVDVYGLTRLRLAAGIWMALVASCLGLTIWQVWARRDNAWLSMRGAALGLGTLYAASFLSFDAVIARHNLSRSVPMDTDYLCQLGEAAVPTIRTFEQVHRITLCPRRDLQVSTPADWREWGFRNWRARRSLAAVTTEVAP